MLLLMSFFTPVALQACELGEFCMMEMSSQMPDQHHECYETSGEVNGNSAHSHHDCEGGSVCDCYVDQFTSNEEILVPVSSVAIILQKGRFNLTLFSSDEPLRPDQQVRIGQHDPPVYLLYDTLLI